MILKKGCVDSLKAAKGVTMEHSKKKIFTISVLETFLCLFVIFIHLSSDVLIHTNPQSVFTGFIFFCSKAVSFVVPAFIFSSAFKLTMKYKNEKVNYFLYLWNRLKNIYLPYVIWVVIYYIYFVYCLQYFNFSITDLLRYIVSGDLVAHFYFVIVIMQFYVLMPTILLLCKKKSPKVIGSIAFVITLLFRIFAYKNTNLFTSLQASYVFIFYLIFWVSGVYFALYYEKLYSFLKKTAIWWILLFVVVAFAHLTMSYLQFRNIIFYDLAEYVHYLYCVTAIIGFYCILTVTSPFFTRHFAPFRLVGNISYYIYLSHILFIYMIDHFIQDLSLSVLVRFGIRFITVYVTSITLSYLYFLCKKNMRRKTKTVR